MSSVDVSSDRTNYLAASVCECADENTDCKDDHTGHLKPSVAFALQCTCQHGRHAAKAPQNYVDWHGDVEGECPVVEHIDSKEHECDVGPFAHGHRR